MQSQRRHATSYCSSSKSQYMYIETVYRLVLEMCCYVWVRQRRSDGLRHSQPSILRFVLCQINQTVVVSVYLYNSYPIMETG
jgi:hypothetical protein